MRTPLVILITAGALLAARAPGAQPGPAALSLDEARERAVARNPQWLSTLEQIRVSEARVKQAEAGGRLQVSARSALFYDTSPPFAEVPPISISPGGPPAFPGGTFELAERANARLDVVIERILLGGTVRPNVEAARLALEAARLRAERIRQELLFQVEETYLQAASAEGSTEVARENLRAREAHREVARGRFETGLVPRFDVVRAETDVVAAEEAVARYDNDRELAVGRLALVLGDELDRRYALSLPAAGAEEPPPVDDLVARARARRPDVSSLEEERRASLAVTRAARAERKPVVGVRVEGRANARSIPIDPSGVRVLLLGTWRLYDGGRSRGMQEEAEAQARALELQREQLVRSMALEVRSAYLARQNAGRRLQTAEKQVALATEAREIAGARYELGTGLSSEIAESQAALAEARFSRLRATVDLLVAVARLRLATGDTPPPASLKPAPAPRTLPGR